MSRIENQILEFVFQGKDAGLTGMSSKVEKSLDALHKKADALSEVGDEGQGLFGTLLGAGKAGQTMSTAKMMVSATTGLIDSAIEHYMDFTAEMINLRRITGSAREEQQAFTTDAITATARYGVAQKQVLSIMASLSQGSERTRLNMSGLAADMAYFSKITGASATTVEDFTKMLGRTTWQPLLNGMQMNEQQLAFFLQRISEQTGATMDDLMEQFTQSGDLIRLVTDPKDMKDRLLLFGQLAAAAKRSGEGTRYAGEAFKSIIDPTSEFFKYFETGVQSNGINATIESFKELMHATETTAKFGSRSALLTQLFGSGGEAAGMRMLGILQEIPTQIDMVAEAQKEAALSTQESRLMHAKGRQGPWERMAESALSAKNSILASVKDLGEQWTSILTPSLGVVSKWFDEWAGIIRTDFSSKIAVAFEESINQMGKTLGPIGRWLAGDINTSQFWAEMRGLTEDAAAQIDVGEQVTEVIAKIREHEKSNFEELKNRSLISPDQGSRVLKYGLENDVRPSYNYAQQVPNLKDPEQQRVHDQLMRLQDRKFALEAVRSYAESEGDKPVARVAEKELIEVLTGITALLDSIKKQDNTLQITDLSNRTIGTAVRKASR